MARGSAFHAAIAASVNQTVRLPRWRKAMLGGPIRHPVPLLRDVMAAILVRFEWHGDGPGSGTGPPSYTLHPSPPNDRSVQQGQGVHESLPSLKLASLDTGGQSARADALLAKFLQTQRGERLLIPASGDCQMW